VSTIQQHQIVTPLDSISHFSLLVREGFFDKSTCEDIVAAMCSSESGPATLYGRTESGTIDNNIRRSLKCQLSPTIANLVNKKLCESTSEIEQHFSVKVRECEEPQFLHYRVGDFFVAHQDGNTGLLRLDQENRRVSVVIFLSSSDAHCGGELVFHDYREQRRFAFSMEKAGTLIAFPSETTHEVTPLISGERFSIACWYR
jgi:SM-20-related protein